MEGDNRGSGQGSTDELTRRTADDVAALAHRYAGVAKREVASAGERAIWPAVTAAVGGLLVIVASGMLVASPAVPPSQPRLKRRVRFVAFAYLALGGAGALLGSAALYAGMRKALPRTRHNVREAIDVIRDRL